MEISIIDIVVNFFDRLTLAILLGSSLAVVGIFRLAEEPVLNVVIPIIRRLCDYALITAVITSVAILFLRTANMADVAVIDTLPFVVKVISKSHFGMFWMWRIGALVSLLLFWLVIRKRDINIGYIVIAAVCVVIAFLISSTSHAGDEGLFTLENFVNSVHVIAGLSWGGIIIVYVLLLNALDKHRAEMSNVITDSVTGLSIIAAVAFVVVIVAGIVNSWYRLETVSILWSTNYGYTLLFKLVFVAAMIAMAVLNRFFVVPAVGKLIADGGLPEKENKLIINPVHLLLKVLSVDAIAFLLVTAAAVTLAMQSPTN